MSDDERRCIGLWAADCAERVLPLYEAEAPWDTRPREAIEAVRTFGRGGKRTAELRSAAWASLAAAREVGGKAASAAARAAGLAAGTAYTHALLSPHQANHILGPAVYAAWARELASPGESDAARQEIEWAITRAPQTVRDVLRRLPARHFGRSRPGALFFEVDAGLRG